jgi:MYXO-CTERM domain-containing protein
MRTLVLAFWRFASAVAVPSLAFSACTAKDPRPDTSIERLALGEVQLSPEFPVDHPMLREESPLGTERVAAGPSSYLAVSALAQDTTVWPFTNDIVATRIRADASVVDPTGVVLGTGDYPNAVFTTDHWVVLWRQGTALYCARLFDDGTAPDPGGRPLGLNGVPYRLGWDGSHVFVLGFDGQAFLLDAGCMPTTAPVTLLPADASRYPSLAFDGTNYLVGYSTAALGSPDRFVIQKVTTAGVPTGAPIDIATAAWTRNDLDTEGFHGVEGSVASEAGVTLLAYSMVNWDSVNRIGVPGIPRYRALNSNGTLGTEHVVQVSSGSLVSAQPMGDGFALNVTWPSSQPVLIQVRTDGTEVRRLQSLPDAYASPLVLHRGNDLLLSASGRIWRYSLDLTLVSGPTPIVLRASNEWRPAVASAGSVRLVAWDEFRDGVYASRVSSSGAILDAEPLVVRAKEEVNTSAGVASNGTDFLVSVSVSGGSYGFVELKRVSSNGVLDAEPIVLGPNAFVGKRGMGSDGSNYLVAWAQWGINGETQVLATRIAPTGVVVNPTPLLVESGTYLDAPAVAFDGESYVIAYNTDSGTNIHVARVSPSGSLLGVGATPWHGSLTGFGWGRETGLLTYWVPGTNQTLLGGIVPAQGGTFDPRSISVSTTPSGYHYAPVAWDGTNFWVAWQDTRRGSLGPSLSGERYALDVYAGRYSADGTALDPGGILVKESELNRSRDPDVALAPEAGRVFAAYAIWDPSHGYHSVRLRGRTLSSGPDGDGGAAGAGGDGGDVTGGTGGSGTGGRSRGGESGGGASGTSGATGTGGAGGDATPGGAGGDDSGEAGADGTSRGGTTGSAGSSAGEGTEPERSSRNHDDEGGCSIVSAGDARGALALALAALGLALAVRRRQRNRGDFGAD